MSVFTQNAFLNIPNKDYLGLLDGTEARPQKVMRILEFKKPDVAKATGIKSKSIRYDNKMPKLLKNRLREWAILMNLVAQFFEGNAEKTTLWFVTPNPMFGNISPRDLIRFGKYKKLLKFILDARDENKW